MTALGLTVLAASLLGSLHCAGMCGGFVAFYSGGLASGGRRSPIPAHLAYNAGRLGAYVALGAAAGGLGEALDLAGRLAGLQRAAAVIAGALIVLWGGMSLAAVLGVRVPHLRAPGTLQGVVASGLRRLAAAPPAARALGLGLLTGCLPCGWLYAFVVTAAGTGSAPGGAALMVVFWMGTLPVMVTLASGLLALAGPLRRHVPAACAVAMIVVGLLGVAGRFPAAPRPLAGSAPASAGALASPAPGTVPLHGRH